MLVMPPQSNLMAIIIIIAWNWIHLEFIILIMCF